MRQADEHTSRVRLDKWLWYARFFKSRSLAVAQCRARKIRVNGEHCKKASATVEVGDVLTFPKAGDVKVVKVVALGARRGPASEAQLLYKDLTPKKPPSPAEQGKLMNPSREKGAGRPTKTDRRALDRLMERD